MNQTLYHNSFKLNADMISEDDEFANFAGLISTYSLNKYGYHMTRKSLTNFRNAINHTDNIKLFVNHKTYNLMIGKPYGATLKQDGCYTNIGILKGLQDEGSDDIIKRIRNEILTDFSIGHRGGTYTCDICESKMFGYFWMECENGHVMGEEYKDKGKKKMCTATCDDAELTEVSVVGRGADPDAKIIKKLKDDLISQKVSTNQLYVLSELYNLDINRFCEQLGYDPDRYKQQYSIPKRRKPMAEPTPKPKNDGDLDILKESTRQLEEELQKKTIKVEELEQELSESYSAEEYEDVQRQVSELTIKMKELEDKQAENEAAIELGETALQVARDNARRAYVSMRLGDEDLEYELKDDADYLRNVRSINKETDIDNLYETARRWRNIANSRKPSGRQSILEPPIAKAKSTAERRHIGINNW